MSDPYGAPYPPAPPLTRPPPDPALVEWLREYRRPKGTIALIALISFVFLVQMGIGGLGAFVGGKAAYVSVRLMGGVMASDVLQHHAVWELGAAAFLHFGIWHIGMNCWVLYRLGQLLEPSIGWQRLFLAFVVSAVVGNALALGSGEVLSAGASGGIWGLMTLAGALVVRRPDIFPGQLAARMRPGLIQTLALNALISFIPGVSWLAHMGGGIAGALLGFSGALTFNVLRFPVPPARPLWLTIASVASTGLALLCVPVAIVYGYTVLLHGG